ncbi:MAG: 3-(3-hydroxy-phenyl)propionate hydroxylase [Acidimicrobiaceae bacterium]|nr:3-(3-hydroxy-phenyl)propionate hydroxylase [Acidimicrobiaceae bacterium]
MANDADVVIVGAGPVGLTLANLLGLYGLRTIILEERASLIDYPRGVGMDDETLRTFQAIGVVDNVLPHTTPDQWLRFMDARGRCVASIEPRTRQFGWPRRNAFIQPLVDQVLLEGLDRFDHVEVQWNSPVNALDENATGVHVSVGDGTDRQVDTAYVVGCDGGRSFVRRHMGVTWDGTTNSTRWLVVDIRDDPIGIPGANVHGDWRRPYVSIALPHGMRRFEFMMLAGEDETTMGEQSQVDRIIRSVVPDIGPIDYVRHRVYTHHARVAGSFIRGRIMIGGDAAHLMPVWQGQGYNSGIRDAANLGWKLASVMKGSADRRILDTYDSERRGHAAAMVKLSEAAGLLVRQTSRYRAAFRDAITRSWDFVPPLKRYVVEMRYKPMPKYTAGIVVDASSKKTSAVGTLFIQPTVMTREDGTKLLDDVLGQWFAVVAWGDDPRAHLSAVSLEAWERLGARFVIVRPQTQLHWGKPDDDRTVVIADPSGDLKAWFDQQQSSVAILRPDRFVAAAGRPIDLNDVTGRLVDLLGAGADGPGV